MKLYNYWYSIWERSRKTSAAVFVVFTGLYYSTIFKVTLVEHCIILRMPTRENKVKTCTGVNTVQVCFLCQAPASEQCSHCKLVYYCSKAHYNLHRVTLQEVSDDLVHGLWRLSEEIAFSVRSKINSHSQFFRSATSTQIFRFLWFIPSLGVGSPCFSTKLRHQVAL